MRVAAGALPRFLRGRRPDSVRVEEVIPTDDGHTWRITLSYLEPGVPAPEPAFLRGSRIFTTPPAPERVHRAVVVDGESGEARSMQLREAG